MKKNKLVKNVLCCALATITLVTPTFANAYNYQFNTDANKDFGIHTFTSDNSYGNNNENVRKDKNYALNPPQYGLFSGEFETTTSNPFMTKQSIATATNNTYSMPTHENTTGELLPSTSLMNTNNINNSISSNVSIIENGNYYDNYGYKTEAMYYSDGSIGTLNIIDYDIEVKVYEGETLENLRLGVGHFKNTSAWDGNVAIAGHNRGTYGYFNALKSMRRGDEVKYTTKYGTRTYEMVSRTKIDFNDMSYFNYSHKNILTLVTCVEDEPDFRYVVILEEK